MESEMTDNTVAALHAAMRDNPELRKRFGSASSPEDFERLAAEAGFKVASKDFFAGAGEELTDADLENIAGGYTFPRTDWIYCDNPWTNFYCTLKC